MRDRVANRDRREQAFDRAVKNAARNPQDAISEADLAPALDDEDLEPDDDEFDVDDEDEDEEILDDEDDDDVSELDVKSLGGEAGFMQTKQSPVAAIPSRGD